MHSSECCHYVSSCLSKSFITHNIVIRYLACIFSSNDTTIFALNVGNSVSVGNGLFHKHIFLSFCPVCTVDLFKFTS